MTKKFQNITNKVSPAAALILFVGLWAALCRFGDVPAYMLPTPGAVWSAFVKNLPVMTAQARVTLTEAFAGLFIGIALAFVFAAVMDRFNFLYQAFYPILVITQTIPTIALAPLLILWMGYEMEPKIALVVITTFFPITVALLDGFKSVDPDSVLLLRSMGAGNLRIFRYVKLPAALPHFFSGLKISASYAVVGAVIAEWLGGFSGLGVYMTKAKKAYAFDKMFAVIFLIVAISLLLMLLVAVIRRLAMPWRRVVKK